jgi:hypothetical protein
VLGLVCGLDGSNAQRQQEVGIAVLKEALRAGGYPPKRTFQTVAEFHRCFAKRQDLSSIQLDGSHTLAKNGGAAISYQGRKAGRTTNALFLADN